MAKAGHALILQPGIFLKKRTWKQGGIIICLFLAACGSVQTQSAQAVATCISSTPSVNPYLLTQNTIANSIYDQYRNRALSLESARAVALSQLQQSAQRWSARADIVLKDKTGVRITVTYISPELLEFIVLNDVLYNDVVADDFHP